jgi:hypothetical protein
MGNRLPGCWKINVVEKQGREKALDHPRWTALNALNIGTNTTL